MKSLRLLTNNWPPITAGLLISIYAYLGTFVYKPHGKQYLKKVTVYQENGETKISTMETNYAYDALTPYQFDSLYHIELKIIPNETNY